MTLYLDEITRRLVAQVGTLVEGAAFPADGSRVLVASGRYDKIGTPIEILVALALAQRGADVRFLLCDRVMPACEVRRIDRDTAETCADCWHNGQTLLNASGLPLIPFSAWLSPDDLREVTAEIDCLPPDAYETFSLEGVQVGRIACASTVRYFLRGSLETDEHRAKLREFLITAALMLRLTKRAIAEFSPDAIFISHGIYVTWGVITEYAALMGIRVIVYGYGYRKGTVLLSQGASYHSTLVTEDPHIWRDTPLTPEQEQTIRAYLASRANGGLDWIHYNTGQSRPPEELRARYGLNPGKKTLVLFTNIAWDAAVVFHNTAFADMRDWLIHTIQWCIDHPENQLIIRCHPAENRRLSPVQQQAEDIIHAAFPALPEHIRLLASAADVNTYDLTALADVTLVYTTKVGLEFATRNIPVIVAGEAYYRGKGFTYDPASTADYDEMLSRAPGNPLPNQTDLALRYAYHYFFRRYVELPGLQDAGIGQPVLSLDVPDLQALNAGVHAGLDKICAAILKGMAFSS